jgi:hypothetical protein
MNNNDLLQIALDICKKDSKGMAVSPDTFGYYLDWSQRQYFEQEFAKYASTRRVEDTLLPFVIQTTLSSSPFVLPTDYKHAISAIATYSGLSGNYPIDMVTHSEYLERMDNNLTAPSAKNPVMYFYRGALDLIEDRFRIKFDAGESVVLSTMVLVYLRTPHACIFDYYIDAEGEVVYLEEDAEYTLQANEEYRAGDTSGTFTSISKELWWNDHDKLKVLEMALIKMGVKMENNAVMQYAGMLNQTNAVQS